MKKFLITIVLLIVVSQLYAQHKLSNSRERGYYTYIYRLTEKETFDIAAKPNTTINDSFLHSVVDSFYYSPDAVYKGKLPYGSYLYVNAIKNQLVYRLVAVQNVQLNFLNILKNVQFNITDLKGNEVTNAAVKIGKNKKVKYDQQAHLYLAKVIPKVKVIKVNYDGVNNYFAFDKIKDWTYDYYQDGKKNKRYIPSEPQPMEYKGYLVFNKPKYKPLDTVKFKSYLVKAKGQTIKNKPLRVELYKNYSNTNAKVLGEINPYRDGGYTFDFVLADSLGLQLDNDYVIVLKEAKGEHWNEIYRGGFRYEDYELKAINFSVRTDKAEHSPGKPVTAYISAKDENDLAVPDGRVEVYVFTNNVYKFRDSRVFVPDSLWKTELKLDPVGETKLVLPDSIFPKADINYTVQFVFLNSNNERQETNRYFSYFYKRSAVRASLKNDSLNFVYLLNGDTVIQKAKFLTFYADSLKADSSEITLPFQLKLDPKIVEYRLVTADGYKERIKLSSLSPQLTTIAEQTLDSLIVKVENPQKIYFWYTIFSGDQIIDKGYAAGLNKGIKHSGKKTAHVRLNYVWDGQGLSNEVSAVYRPEILNLKLDAPEVIYPGQQVKMEVKVTDVNDKAVPFTDVTAFAYTAKFNNSPSVILPDFNKFYKERKQAQGLTETNLEATGQYLLNWEKWGKTLGLDTITYYQFTHPQELFMLTEAVKDSITQISPFVVKDGAIVPLHVVYIDEVPVFFSKTDQLQRFSFPVSPGTHLIRLRTNNEMITMAEVAVEKGKRTILSVVANKENKKAKIESAPTALTNYESALLSKYLVSVKDNFFDRKTLIEAGDKQYLLNPSPGNFGFSNKLIGPIAENYLKFLSGDVVQSFVKEPGYLYTFTKGLTKQKSNNPAYGFSADLASGIKQHSENFNQEVLSKGEIDKLWEEYLDLRSYSTSLFINYDTVKSTVGKLTMELDTALANKMPFVKNILIFKSNQPEKGKIYPGNSSWFPPLAIGNYRIMYLFKDNRYFIADGVVIKPYGENHFKWSTEKVLEADSLSIRIDRFIKSVEPNASRYNNETVELKVSEIFNQQYFDSNLIEKADQNKVNDFLSLGNELSEVAVVGYGTSRNKATASSSLAGKVAGVQVGADPVIRIRGKNSIPALTGKPLIIVDGLPFQGSINDISPDNILEMSVLKDAAATALYGSRAAGGIIIIKTKKGNQVANASGEMVAQTQTMRTNFSDYGFWQPRLLTDENGIARWNAKFPDDMTSWSTAVIAVNGNKQAGQLQTNIRSFKSLSANFVAPLFALEGDTINVIGKLMNYTPAEETVTRKFTYNDKELRNNIVKIKNAYIDTVSIVANGKDSLAFKYTLEQPNGYFDGELRKIPVFKTGVVETKGFFDVLTKDSTVTYNFLPVAGKVTLRAEASVFPALLDEMDKLRNYEYLCNEQLASKLKALLLEKSVRAYLNTPFKHEKNIKELIKKLQANKTEKETWGWWGKSPEQMWITLHAAEALLKAQNQGYTINLNKELLHSYLISLLADQNSYDRVYCVKLLNMLNGVLFIKDWVGSIEQQQQDKLKNPKMKVTLYEKLQLMQLKQMAGLTIDIPSLLALHKNTMFGAIYWGEQSFRFWDNSIQSTLLAYQILKKEGKHANELERIRRYFLEQRKDGQWRNTYESSLILETILPDLMIGGKQLEPSSLVLNGTEVIKEFPFTRVMEPATVKISKKGILPIYFTAYQQYVNPTPEKVNKDFTVRTSFIQNQVSVKSLKAGVKTKLKVEVDVRADADYVLIEVPIPAGCSYENKTQSYWGAETHREYFKNKTAIFCTKLKSGKYSFEIELMPRYTGNYILNPAKAEMMYFPVFYGREGMKRMPVN